MGDRTTGRVGAVDARAGPPEAGAPLHLRLLGGPRLSRGGTEIHLPLRGQRVVCLLALRGTLPRSAVAGYLWPDVAEHRARQSVRAAVHDVQAKAPELLAATVAQVGLQPHVLVDVHLLRRLVHRLLRRDPPPQHDGPHRDPLPTAGWTVPDLAAALVPPGPLSGLLLPGWTDDWVVAEAERLHHLHLHALDVLVDGLLDRADHVRALQVALTAVEIDPLRESTHRAVMRVFLAEGNAVEALRQYERFRAMLRMSMGIEPSRRMLDLVAGIRQPRGVPGVTAGVMGP